MCAGATTPSWTSGTWTWRRGSWTAWARCSRSTCRTLRHLRCWIWTGTRTRSSCRRAWTPWRRGCGVRRTLQGPEGLAWTVQVLSVLKGAGDHQGPGLRGQHLGLKISTSTLFPLSSVVLLRGGLLFFILETLKREVLGAEGIYAQVGTC